MEEDDQKRKALGARFKEARALLALSKSAAARASGLYQRDVSQIEDGVKRFIPTSYLQFMSIRIDLNSLFDERMEVTMRALPGEEYAEPSRIQQVLEQSGPSLPAITVDTEALIRQVTEEVVQRMRIRKL